jgi:hypothetical protein
MHHDSRRHRNAEVDFKGEKRSNATHASVTDPDARLYKKSPGAGAMLCFMGHTLMENRNGLVVQGDLTQADGHAERKAALDMIHRHSPGSTRRLTLGADKGYDAAGFVSDLPSLRHATCRPEIEIFSDRRTHDPTRGICVVPEAPKEDRRAVRLGQNRRRHGTNHVSGRRTRPIPLHPDHGRQQPCPTTKVAGGMKGNMDTEASRGCADRHDPSVEPDPMTGKRSGSATISATC